MRIAIQLMTCVLLLMAVVMQIDAATLDDHVAAMRARAVKLQNITVRYDMTEICTPPENRQNLRPNSVWSWSGQEISRVGDYVTQEEYRRNGADMRFTSVSIKDPRQPDFMRREASFVEGKLSLIRASGGGFVIRVLVNSLYLSVVDIALGIREPWRNETLDPATAIVPATLSVLDGDRVELTLTDEKNIEHVWTFDADNDYAIVQFRSTPAGPGAPRIRMRMSDFKQAHGVTLPTTIVQEVHVPEDGSFHLTSTYTATVTEYKLNDADNTPDKLRIGKPIP